MPEYKVKQRYRSYRDGRQFGPYEPGTVVELEEADAEWVERDSPGTLAPVAQKKTDADGETKVPQADRQHRGGKTRG